MLAQKANVIVEIDQSHLIESVTCQAAVQEQFCQTQTLSNEQFNLVLSNLNSISSGVNTLPVGIYKLEIMAAFLAAISSAIAAFTINYFYWKRVEKKKVVAKLAIEIINVLNQFEDVACEYWSDSYNIEKQKKYMIQENKIVNCINLITQYTESVTKKLDSPILMKKMGHKPTQDIQLALDTLKQFSDTIYEIAAADDFKSEARVKSPKKVRQISKKCTNLKAKLSSIAY